MPKTAETKAKVDSILYNTNQFPHRISLAQAAQMSGYHQDYLGQLCRLGKLRASKIGRNWYTTQSELQSLLNNPVVVEVEEVMNDAQSQPTAEQIMAQMEQSEAAPEPPVVTSNYIVSEVTDIPIRLEQRPQMARSQHTLQSLVTRMRLDNLRSDVLKVVGMVDKISTEQMAQKEMLLRHDQILQARTDLREQYVPSLGIANSHQPGVDMIEFANSVPVDQNQEPVQIVWLWPALAMVVAVAVSSLFILSSVSNSEPQLSTVIYKPQTQQIEYITPEVAGETIDSIEPIAPNPFTE